MKNFIALLKARDLKGLLSAPSNNLFVQLFRYILVGGTAFVIDAGSLWLMLLISVNEYIATAAAFLLGLTVNFILSKSLVFSHENARVKGVWEFISYGLIGVIGLGITELLMFMGLEWLHCHPMLVKIIAALIVLMWNFAARKFFVYSNRS